MNHRLTKKGKLDEKYKTYCSNPGHYGSAEQM